MQLAQAAPVASHDVLPYTKCQCTRFLNASMSHQAILAAQLGLEYWSDEIWISRRDGISGTYWIKQVEKADDEIIEVVELGLESIRRWIRKII